MIISYYAKKNGQNHGGCNFWKYELLTQDCYRLSPNEEITASDKVNDTTMASGPKYCDKGWGKFVIMLIFHMYRLINEYALSRCHVC